VCWRTATLLAVSSVAASVDGDADAILTLSPQRELQPKRKVVKRKLRL